MTEINLLPQQIKQKREATKFNLFVLRICSYILLSFILLLLIVEGVNQYLAFKLKAKEAKIEAERREIALYADVETKVKKLKENIELISELEKNKISWSSILNELSSSTPSFVQIQSFSASPKNTPHISISGKATSRKEIAKFREKLESSLLFSQTLLGPSTEARTLGGEVYYPFTLTANFEALEKKK